MAKKKPKDAEGRLENLEVHEVSVVDRPANKRRFLIVKRDESGNLAATLEGDMPTQKTTNVDASLLDILGLVLDTSDDENATVGDVVKTTQPQLETAITSLIQKLSMVIAQTKDGKITDELSKAALVVADDLTKLTKNLGLENPVSVDQATLNTALGELMKSATAVKNLDKEATEIPDELIKQLSVVDSSIRKAVGVEVKQETPQVDQVEDKLQIFVNKKDNEIILKRGAMMKKARLNQFQKAVETLMSILKELQGGDDSTKTTKNDSTIAEQLAKGFEILETRITEKLAAAVAGLKEDLEKVSKRVEDIDNASPGGNGDAGEEEVVTEKNKKPSLWGNVFGR